MLALVLTAPLAATAYDGGGKQTAPLAATAYDVVGSQTSSSAFVPAALIRAAESHPNRTFQVIVQGTDSRSRAVATDVETVVSDNPGLADGVETNFQSISGVAAELTGTQILELGKSNQILAITPDGPIELSDDDDDDDDRDADEGVSRGQTSSRKDHDRRRNDKRKLPAIAIVDSGIDATRSDFGGRVVAQVDLATLAPNSPGDGRGHGTFVAGIAAGTGPGYVGAAPTAPLVSIDVINDQGAARTSDVISAADWILKNKKKYRIGVANFSLHSYAPAKLRFDPLDRAVESLWLNGVVVVTSAGNYGHAGRASGVPFAPANDPFVITVGATDTNGTSSLDDDFNAPWTAFGPTLDGFSKPELGAPGRYLVGPVPPASTMALERPDRIVAPGYMRLSGTSFSAATVSGVAAQILAKNPRWTPDQVKGALMVSARPLSRAVPFSVGVGAVDAARVLHVKNPPNPNAALNKFVVEGRGHGSGLVFDGASWESTARTNVSWDSASWSDASWNSAAWPLASWQDASWHDASWSSVAEVDASWQDASWNDASWNDHYLD